MNLSLGRGGTALRNSPNGRPFPRASANSPTRNASNCNSSKTCNAPTYTNSTKRGAMRPSCKLQPDTYTVETLAEKIGRSEKYVYARLRLTHLVDEVQQAFYAAKADGRACL